MKTSTHKPRASVKHNTKSSASEKQESYLIEKVPVESPHVEQHVTKSQPKINNALIAVVSIFAIFLLAYFVVTFRANDVVTTQNIPTLDSSGQVSQVLSQDVTSFSAFCKLIVGRTTLYDDTTLAVSLESGSATYYAGNTIRVEDVNDNGCIVTVNGAGDYLAIGQIQRIGGVYITIKDVVN